MSCERCEYDLATVECLKCGDKTDMEPMRFCVGCSDIVHQGRLSKHQLKPIEIKMKYIDFYILQKEKDELEQTLAEKDSELLRIEKRLAEVENARADMEEMQRIYQRNIRKTVISIQQMLKEKATEIIKKLQECSQTKIEEMNQFIQLYKQQQAKTKEKRGKLSEVLQKDDAEIEKFYKSFSSNDEKDNFTEALTSTYPAAEIQFQMDYTNIVCAVKEMDIHFMQAVAVSEQLTLDSPTKNLTEDKKCKAIAQSLLDGRGVCWVQPKLNDQAYHTLRKISLHIRKTYLTDPDWQTFAESQSQPAVGELCYALYANDRSWYRAKVEDVGSRGKDSANVRFLDFGNAQLTKFSHILPARADIAEACQYQAIECCLMPTLDTAVPSEARWLFSDHLSNRELTAVIEDKIVTDSPGRDVYYVKLYYQKEDRSEACFNEILEKKVAEHNTPKAKIACRDYRLTLAENKAKVDGEDGGQAVSFTKIESLIRNTQTANSDAEPPCEKVDGGAEPQSVPLSENPAGSTIPAEPQSVHGSENPAGSVIPAFILPKVDHIARKALSQFVPSVEGTTKNAVPPFVPPTDLTAFGVAAHGLDGQGTMSQNPLKHANSSQLPEHSADGAVNCTLPQSQLQDRVDSNAQKVTSTPDTAEHTQSLSQVSTSGTEVKQSASQGGSAETVVSQPDAQASITESGQNVFQSQLDKEETVVDTSQLAQIDSQQQDAHVVGETCMQDSDEGGQACSDSASAEVDGSAVQSQNCHEDTQTGTVADLRGEVRSDLNSQTDTDPGFGGKRNAYQNSVIMQCSDQLEREEKSETGEQFPPAEESSTGAVGGATYTDHQYHSQKEANVCDGMTETLDKGLDTVDGMTDPSFIYDPSIYPETDNDNSNVLLNQVIDNKQTWQCTELSDHSSPQTVLPPGGMDMQMQLPPSEQIMNQASQVCTADSDHGTTVPCVSSLDPQSQEEQMHTNLMAGAKYNQSDSLPAGFPETDLDRSDTVDLAPELVSSSQDEVDGFHLESGWTESMLPDEVAQTAVDVVEVTERGQVKVTDVPPASTFEVDKNSKQLGKENLTESLVHTCLQGGNITDSSLDIEQHMPSVVEQSSNTDEMSSTQKSDLIGLTRGKGEMIGCLDDGKKKSEWISTNVRCDDFADCIADTTTESETLEEEEQMCRVAEKNSDVIKSDGDVIKSGGDVTKSSSDSVRVQNGSGDNGYNSKATMIHADKEHSPKQSSSQQETLAKETSRKEKKPMSLELVKMLLDFPLNAGSVFYGTVAGDLAEDGLFWIRINHTGEALDAFDWLSEEFREIAESAKPLKNVKPGKFCLTMYDSRWCRGCVEDVINDNGVKFLVMDYGITLVVQKKRLRNIPKEYMSVKPQARKCNLSSAEYASFCPNACAYFKTLVAEKCLRVYVVKTETKTPAGYILYVRLFDDMLNIYQCIFEYFPLHVPVSVAAESNKKKDKPLSVTTGNGSFPVASNQSSSHSVTDVSVDESGYLDTQTGMWYPHSSAHSNNVDISAADYKPPPPPLTPPITQSESTQIDVSNYRPPPPPLTPPSPQKVADKSVKRANAVKKELNYSNDQQVMHEVSQHEVNVDHSPQVLEQSWPDQQNMASSVQHSSGDNGSVASAHCLNEPVQRNTPTPPGGASPVVSVYDEDAWIESEPNSNTCSSAGFPPSAAPLRSHSRKGGFGDKPFHRKSGDKPFDRSGDKPSHRSGDKPFDRSGDKPFEKRSGQRNRRKNSK